MSRQRERDAVTLVGQGAKGPGAEDAEPAPGGWSLVRLYLRDEEQIQRRYYVEPSRLSAPARWNDSSVSLAVYDGEDPHPRGVGKLPPTGELRRFPRFAGG